MKGGIWVEMICQRPNTSKEDIHKGDCSKPNEMKEFHWSTPQKRGSLIGYWQISTRCSRKRPYGNSSRFECDYYKAIMLLDRVYREEFSDPRWTSDLVATIMVIEKKPRYKKHI
jgi:hypothetical protein